MPAYVDHPDHPGTPIDVVVLQGENPLRVLPAFLLPEWMKRDTWSRREAVMLLAGYNPNVTRWSETTDGFGQYSAGNVGYLDGLSESMIRAASVNWRHPRYEEALQQFWMLSDYANGSSLDERKLPSEWIAWASSKGFTPYWSHLARAVKESSMAYATNEQERGHPRAIGHVVRFNLSASPVINGMATISVGSGEVIRPDGKKVLYGASSVNISHTTPGARKRVYLHDPRLSSYSDADTSSVRSLMANCDDDDLRRGVYEGGLIVAGHIILVAYSPTKPIEEDPLEREQYRNHLDSEVVLKPVSRQASQESELRQTLKDLGYDLNALPKGGPGNPGPKSAARAKLKWTNSIFDKAWDRLRANGAIKDA
jgi:hypothetical protein